MASKLPIAGVRLARGGGSRSWAQRIAVACLCLLAVSTWGQAKPSEYDVKAAYLFNFGKFMRVTGGTPAGGAFNICILGRDPLGHTMDQIADNESIGGRPVHVMRIAEATVARGCAIVFISRDDGGAISDDLAALAGSNALTVSDAPDFLERGGMIQFLLQGDHVRFAVNLEAVNRTQIVLSSELLRVAASVKGVPR